MTSATREEQEALMQVVRGERPWTDLGGLGITVTLEGDRCTVENPQHLTATVGTHDLAQGFAAHLHDPRVLREWAFVVESLDIDLDVEEEPAGELLLNALWDASFGTPLEPEVSEAIEQLARPEKGPEKGDADRLLDPNDRGH